MWASWQRAGSGQVADAALVQVIAHWRRADHGGRADNVTTKAWQAGCRHPDVVDSCASLIAAPGRVVRLNEGVEACDEALALAGRSTNEAWLRLLARRAQLAGRRRRLMSRPSNKIDTDGKPVPYRRHHPTNPQRQRCGRFIQIERGDADAGECEDAAGASSS